MQRCNFISKLPACGVEETGIQGDVLNKLNEPKYGLLKHEEMAINWLFNVYFCSAVSIVKVQTNYHTPFLTIANVYWMI